MNISNTIEMQRSYFYQNGTQKYNFRIEQLTKLEKAIKQYTDSLYEAFQKDLKKPPFEVYTTEIGFVLQSIRETKQSLRAWMKPQKSKKPIFLWGSKSYSIFEPYGTVLIIGPFNYPFQLIMAPLIGAISAGNTVVIKPSELTPNVSNVVQQLLESIFDPQYVAVIQGGIPETTALLAERFDHIFFTGSPHVGQIVMEAASKHLTPVTLELGGKSPAIITKTSKLEEAAQKIAWGKFINTGQTCVAPDYILIEESLESSFIQTLTDVIQRFYQDDPKTCVDYGCLATEGHTKRLLTLLEQTNGEIVLGGNGDLSKRYIAPTIIKNVLWNDILMKEEIFGPILPILTYNEQQFTEKVIHPIRSGEKPLALYLFTNDSIIEKKVLEEISFGGGVINDTLLHLTNNYLPFGGVGQSGIGHYHGKYSFETFSHQKAIVKKSTWPNLKMLYPPYTKKNLDMIKKIMK